MDLRHKVTYEILNNIAINDVDILSMTEPYIGYNSKTTDMLFLFVVIIGEKNNMMTGMSPHSNKIKSTGLTQYLDSHCVQISW